MRRLTITPKSIITRFSLTSLLIIAAVLGIVVINLWAFSSAKNLLLVMIEDDVSQIVRNAEFGRAINDIFAKSQLLINSFSERKDTVEAEGQLLLAALEKQRALFYSQGEYAQGALDEFHAALQDVFGQCLLVNDRLEAIQALQDELLDNLNLLDERVVERSLHVTIEGEVEEAESIEQLGSMLGAYREVFLQAIIQFVNSKQAHLSAQVIRHDYEHKIFVLLDELHAGLGATTSAWEDIHPLIEHAMETVKQYRAEIGEFHAAIHMFEEQLNLLRHKQQQVMQTMEMVDGQITRKTRSIGARILESTQKSIHITLLLSGIIALVLILVEVYMIRSVQPLKVLSRIAGQLSEGNIRCQVNTLDRRKNADEIEALTEAFRKLIRYNQEMADIATAFSLGDLSHHIRPRSKDDVLGQAFVNMTSYLNDLALAATAIADGDLNQDIHPKTDEDVLGNAFRTMALHLHESFDVIETQLGEIQQAAELRANLLDDLQQKNEALEQEIMDRKAAEEAAKAANLAKGEFLANISHELRTPLNFILGMVQAIQGDEGSPVKDREHLDSILQSGNHLLVLVNRLIDASRLEKNRPDFEKRQFDFQQLLQEVKNEEDWQTARLTAPKNAEEPEAQYLLTSVALHALPDSLQNALQDAAEIADFETASEIIQQVRQHDIRLAEALQKVISEYQFEHLHRLLNPAGEIS